MKETVTFVNDGLLHARVSWIPNDDERTAAVRVRPENFAVFARTKIDLLIEPRRPGPLRETLEFRAENDDGHATRLLVYVRGVVHHRTPPEEVRVSGGQALVSPSHATVCAGTPASHAVRLRVEPVDKGDRFSVQRRTYLFDVSDDKATGVLTERGAVKSFGPYAAAAATLDFEAPLQTEVSLFIKQPSEWRTETEKRNGLGGFFFYYSRLNYFNFGPTLLRQLIMLTKKFKLTLLKSANSYNLMNLIGISNVV